MGAICQVGVTWEAQTTPAEPEVFCHQNQTNFRQLPNGRFSPNLATTRKKIMFHQNVSERIFENVRFTVLKIEGGQTGTLLRPVYNSWNALQRHRSLHVVFQVPGSFQCR